MPNGATALFSFFSARWAHSVYPNKHKRLSAQGEAHSILHIWILASAVRRSKIFAIISSMIKLNKND